MLADMGDNTNGGSGVHSVGAGRRNHPNGNGASSLAQAEAEANATMLLCNVCSDGHDDNGREEEEDEKLSNTTNSDWADCKSAEKSAKKTTDHKTPPQHDENTEKRQQPDNNTNDVDVDNNDFSVQLSANCPSLRRSTRVSALNAKKQQSEQRSAAEQQDRDSSSCTKSRQRTDELDMVQEHSTGAGDVGVPTTGMDVDGDASTLSQSPQHRVTSLKRKLKRKLDDGQELDQYDCKFGIRLDTDGDVVMMSDESDISSLNETDVAVLRERYENVRRQEVPNDVLTQRELQIRELESVLRLEEAKLFMLKKLQQSQQKAVQKMQQQQQQQQQQECVRRLAPGVVQNSSGQAYKPKVAVVNPSTHQSGNANKANGTSQHGKKGLAKADVAALQNGAGIGASLGSMTNSGAGIQLAALPPQHQQVIQQLYTRLSQNPQQLAQMIKTLPHGTGQALTELLRQYAVAQASNMPTSGGQVQNSNAASAAKFSQHLQSSATSQAIAQAQIDAAHKQARELTQQKIVTARQQLRKELDVMVMKLPAAKAPPPDLQFIPNGNQPDFSYLLGLDLTVQRVLKDKSMFRKVDFPPYQCEECETDFTPSWKAICGEQEDYHLYCERCIRQAQKRKVRQDYTALLKRAFQQVQDKEKEFERQVLAGKYNVEPVLPTPPSMAAPTQQQTTTTTSTGSVHNQLKQQQQQHNVQATVSNQSSTSAALKNVSSTVAAAAALQPFNQHQQHHHQQQQQNASSTALNLSKSAGGGGITNTVTSVTSSAKSHHASSSQTKSSSAKRISAGATPSSSSSSATVANPLAALAQNPQLQQQFAAMASFSSSPLFRQMLSNPMLAATMANNPMVFQHLYSALATQQQQRTQQQQQNVQNSAANASGAGAGNAMAAALIQAAAQQVHQQQNRSSTSSATASVSTTNSGGGGSSSAANLPSSTASSSSSSANSIAQQMAAMAAFVSNPMLALQSQLSQLGAGGGGGPNNANAQLLSQLTSNPQLLRQFHQMYLAQQQMKAGTGAGKK